MLTFPNPNYRLSSITSINRDRQKRNVLYWVTERIEFKLDFSIRWQIYAKIKGVFLLASNTSRPNWKSKYFYNTKTKEISFSLYTGKNSKNFHSLNKSVFDIGDYFFSYWENFYFHGIYTLICDRRKTSCRVVKMTKQLLWTFQKYSTGCLDSFIIQYTTFWSFFDNDTTHINICEAIRYFLL